MDSPRSPVLVNIFLQYLEVRDLKIWDELNKSLNPLNSRHLEIKFTMEFEEIHFSWMYLYTKKKTTA